MKYEIYCDDCLNKMKDIEDNSIDLVLIDPPYNIGKAKWDKWKSVDDYVEFMGKVFKEIERTLKPNGSFYFFHNDFLQMVELQSWINKNSEFVFKQLLIWDKFNGSKWNQLNAIVFSEFNRNYSKQCEYCLYYTFQDETGLSKIKLDVNNFTELRNYSKELQKHLDLSIKEINKIMGNRRAEHFFYHSTTQWELCTKEVYELLIEKFNINKWDNFKDYEVLRQEYETLRQEYESQRYTFNNQNISSVLQHEPIKQNGHITPKPVQLLKYLIKTSSNENDVVLDCFMGSGSTGVACMNTNRKFIGIELDEKYFEIAKKRIEESLK